MPTNTPFTVQVNLTVQANNDIGPFEHFATSHFSKTGSLSLGTSSTGVTLQTVPEPSTLMALGLLLLGARRRRPRP